MQSEIYDRALAIMAESSAIPMEFRESAKQHQPNPYIVAVNRYLHDVVDDGRILVLAGAPSRGKTYAAYYALCLGCLMAKTIRPGRMSSVRELVQWSIDDRSEYRELISRDGLVAWDDLGTEHRSESGYSQGVICEMVDLRYTRRLPTIITTNISRGDAARIYGERITSRLTGWGWWYEITPDRVAPMRVTPSLKGVDHDR